MADGIYLGMNGAAARLEQLDAIADNLANAQTPGFKARRAAFEAFLPTGESMDAATTAHVAAVSGGFDLRPGVPLPTGRPLDVFIEGEHFLAVAGPDGAPAFTRDGRLTVDPSGMLRAGDLAVLGASGQPVLVPPGSAVRLSAEGEVLADDVPVDTLAFAALRGPIDQIRSGLFRPQRPDGAAAERGRVSTGQLEGSNVSAMEAAVSLVAAQRHYESATQAIQTYRRMDERANELGRVR